MPRTLALATSRSDRRPPLRLNPIRARLLGALLLICCLLPAANAQVAIDQTFAGGWFDPARAGQGFLIDIDPETQFMFVAWFTHGSSGGKIGGANQRWLTAQGNYAGGQAALPVFSTSGGAFDEQQAVATQQVGSLTVAFSDCRNGSVSFDLGSDGTGSIPIQRVLPGTAALCETGAPAPAAAAPDVFQPTSGPETGLVRSIHRHDGGDLYVTGSETGRVYRSRNDGVTWERLSIVAGGPFASDGAGNLYVANGCELGCASGFGILRSSDGGNSFQRVLSTPEGGFGLLAEGSLILASVFEADGTVSIQRSVDGGASFAPVARSTDLGTELISSFARNPATGSIFVVAFDFFGDGQILRAPADGSTFAPVQTTAGGAAGSLVAAERTIAATADGVVFALDSDGILRSSDDGNTWTRADNGIPENAPGEKSVSALALGPNGVVAAIADFGLVFESRDRGNSWSDISAPVANFGAESIVYAADGFLVATTAVRGILQSDTPREWFFTNSGLLEGETEDLLVTNDQQVIAVTDGTPFLSSDGGRNWERIVPPSAFSAGDFALGPNNELYAGGASDPLVFVSTDFGQSWTQFREPWLREGVSVRDLAVAPDGRLYVATRDSFTFATEQGLFRTSDGINWQVVTNGLPVENENAAAPFVNELGVSRAGTLVAQVFVDDPPSAPVYRSFDGGESWSDTRFPSDRSVRDFHYAADETLYAATSEGLFRLIGDSWVALGVTGESVSAVTTGPDGSIFASESLGGVVQSTDGGATFASIATGLSDTRTPDALAIVNGRLLAGVANDAIHRSASPVPTAPFRINQGLSAAFFEPTTPGQGFLFDFDPTINFAFAAWFTFEAPGNGKVGAPDQRWFTAQGEYSGSGARLELSSTTGGSFDGHQSPTTTPIGTLSFEFRDCQDLRMRYEFDDGDSFSGSLFEDRILVGGAGLCEALRNAQ